MSRSCSYQLLTWFQCRLLKSTLQLASCLFFGFSCFAYIEWTTILLVWSYPSLVIFKPVKQQVSCTVILPPSVLWFEICKWFQWYQAGSDKWSFRECFCMRECSHRSSGDTRRCRRKTGSRTSKREILPWNNRGFWYQIVTSTQVLQFLNNPRS